MARNVTVHAFNDVLGIHLPKKDLTITGLTDVVFNALKVNPDDVVDKYELTPEKYEFRNRKANDEILEATYVLQEDDEIVIYVKQEDE